MSNGVKIRFHIENGVINSAWDKQRLTEEMTFALNKKGAGYTTKVSPLGNYGSSKIWYQKEYESKMMDGTTVEIKYVNYYKYNLGNIFDKYYSYFQLKF